MSHSESGRPAEIAALRRAGQSGRFCNPRRGLQPMKGALRKGHPTTNDAAGRVTGVVFEMKASHRGVDHPPSLDRVPGLSPSSVSSNARASDPTKRR